MAFAGHGISDLTSKKSHIRCKCFESCHLSVGMHVMQCLRNAVRTILNRNTAVVTISSNPAVHSLLLLEMLYLCISQHSRSCLYNDKHRTVTVLLFAVRFLGVFISHDHKLYS